MLQESYPIGCCAAMITAQAIHCTAMEHMYKLEADMLIGDRDGHC